MSWPCTKFNPLRCIGVWALRVVALPLALLGAVGMALFMLAEDVERSR